MPISGSEKIEVLIVTGVGDMTQQICIQII